MSETQFRVDDDAGTALQLRSITVNSVVYPAQALYQIGASIATLSPVGQGAPLYVRFAEAQPITGSFTVEGGLTDAELRATPVPVRQTSATAGAVSSFTTETSAQVLAVNADRKGATIYNRGAGDLCVLLGTGTASATNATVRLATGDYYELPYGFTGAVQGIFLAAGSACVQEIS